jgi:hypothetical protein
MKERRRQDSELEEMIRDIQSRISLWIKNEGLGSDFGFSSYADRSGNSEPSPYGSAILCFWYENELAMDLELQEKLVAEALAGTSFYTEGQDYTSSHIYSSDSELQQDFTDYFRFKWFQKLLACEYDAAHQELYEYFAQNPGRLEEVHWRGFEKLLASVLENNGFRVALGPGYSDGGVDIRLWSHDAVSETLTLVQAKRHNRNHPVKIDAVRSFAQVLTDQGANRGLFVTSSTYLPQVKQFAETKRWRLQLADSTDVARWCDRAYLSIKNQHLSDRYAEAASIHKTLGALHVLPLKPKELVGQMLYHVSCFNGSRNSFALVIGATSSGVLAVRLDSKCTNGWWSIGHQAPILAPSLLETPDSQSSSSKTFWAWRCESDQGSYFSGDDNVWDLWDGSPKSYYPPD